MLKIILFIVNLFFYLGVFLIGVVGIVLTPNWSTLSHLFDSIQTASFFCFYLTFLFISLNWWLGVGLKLDKIFKDYLFAHPFLIGDNMPFSEFSSSIIVKLNFVRGFAYAGLVIPDSKKMPLNAWADDFDYKSKITFFDKILVWGMAAFLFIGAGLFVISLF